MLVTPSLVNVCFIFQHQKQNHNHCDSHLHFIGHNADVYVSGDSPELGKWKTCYALQMQWAGPPNRWHVDFEVSPYTAQRGAFAYKYFVSTPRDVVLMDVHYWESLGPNRFVLLPEVSSPAVLLRTDTWGDTQQSQTTSFIEGPASAFSAEESNDIILFLPVAKSPKKVLGLEGILKKKVWTTIPASIVRSVM